MAHVLIAGGAGFLGSHLADAHVARGDSVIIVDNFSSGTRANITHLAESDAVTVLEHDVIEPLSVDEPLCRIYNLASLASPPRYLAHPIETLRVGSEGTRALLELAQRHGARFILASTSEIYGDPTEHPQREEYWGNVNSIGPRSVYDEAKRYAEAFTMAVHRTHGVSVGIARIFNTYGPRLHPDDGRVLSNFITQGLAGAPLTIYGDGTQTRSFCFVSDLVAGLVLLGDSSETGPFNLGGTNEITMLALAELIVDITGSTAGVTFEPLPVDDPARRRPDTSKARSVLGWEQRVDFREGLGQLVRYYQGLGR